MAKKLTAAQAARLPARSIRYEVPDTAGLRLVIQPSGAKSWALRYCRGDERVKLTLGAADFSSRATHQSPVIGQPLNIHEARSLAAEIARQRALGKDPASERQAEKRRVAEGTTDLFPDVARQFVTEHAKPRNRGWAATAKTLGLTPSLQLRPGGITERWRQRSIREITAADIYAVVDEARRRSVPGMLTRSDTAHVMSDGRGRAVFRALSKLMSWCVQHRKIDTNPAAGGFCPPVAASRDRVLTDAEIKRVWLASGELGKPFAALIRLLLLTGARRNEIAALQWSEIRSDGEGMSICLPASRTKNARSHLVPLSELAVSVIEGLPCRIEGNPFVLSTGTSHVQGFSKLKAKLDAIIEQDGNGPMLGWRLHDLRRTAVTGMIELGILPHVVEAVVNHVSGSAKSGTAGVYNRATLMPERVDALERWSRHVQGLVQGPSESNVVELHPLSSAAA